MVATPQSLEVYQGLAAQGHLYSQYLSELLLATSTGGYSASCVSYLLDTHEHKHPEALLGCEDYLGAMQCALLSLAGGHKDAARALHNMALIMSPAIHAEVVSLLGNGSLAKLVSPMGSGANCVPGVSQARSLI